MFESLCIEQLENENARLRASNDRLSSQVARPGFTRRIQAQVSDAVCAAEWSVVHDATGAASRDESSKADAPTTIANNANRMSTTRFTAKAASDGSFAAGLRYDHARKAHHSLRGPIIAATNEATPVSNSMSHQTRPPSASPMGHKEIRSLQLGLRRAEDSAT